MVLSKRPAYRRPGGFSLLHHARLRSERRLCARWDGQRVRCFAKNGHDWADCFPSIVEAALSMTNTTCLIDGEAGILNEDGTSNFPALRGRGRASEVVLVAFDLLEQYGRNLREQPLIERKRRLKALLGPGEASGRAIQYIDYLTGDGAAIFRHVWQVGLEGIVSKRVDSPYRSGPSRTWLKSKNPDSEAVQREREEEWRQLKPGSPIMRHYQRYR